MREENKLGKLQSDVIFRLELLEGADQVLHIC